MQKKVLCYGFYPKISTNVGDELFKSAFKKLFPTFSFTFTDTLSHELINNHDAVFFGGGSFLYSDIRKSNDISIIKSKPIFYIGVGVEKNIHPTHLELLKLAKAIFIRSPEELSNLKNININSYLIPDIVYALSENINVIPTKNYLFIPNVYLVSNNSDPHWKHASWEYFKSEMSQFISENDTDVFPMSESHINNLSDSCAAIELLNKIKYDKRKILTHTQEFEEIRNIFSKYKVIITQRYHGIILAEMFGIPYIAIHHHDKLKNCQPANGQFISYYNFNKSALNEAINSLINFSKNNIDINAFSEIITEVKSYI